MNVLTVIQNIAIDGYGGATISVQTNENTLRKIEVMLENIGQLEGVKEIRIVGSN